VRKTALLVAYTLMFLFIHAGGADAVSVKLAWDASSDSNVAGYNVYRSTESGNFRSGPLNGATLISIESFTDSTVVSGIYYYVVKAVNSVGMESDPSNEVQTTVDTLPSNKAPIVNAGSDQTITLPATATLIGTVMDDGLPAGTLTYSWSIVSGIGVTLASPNWPTTQASFAAAGTYTLKLTVSDGELSSSDEVVVLVSGPAIDRTPPAVTVTAPVQGAVISSSAGVTISASASDDVGVAGVQFKLNGMNLGAEDTTTPYSVSWNTKKASAGTYTIEAVARDAAGNRTSSTPVTVVIRKHGNNLSAVATTGRIREGRVYINVDGPLNTALAIANDETEAALISFYFTNAQGYDFGYGSFPLETKQSLSSFVNEAPFNLAESMEGTLTFYSSLPVSVMALRQRTNERGEFLITALPITSPLTSPPGPFLVLPQFAVGAGWSTQVVLVNSTDTAEIGNLQFFGSISPGESASPLMMTVNGVPAASFDYLIPPHTSVRFATSNASPQFQSGYVLATASNNNMIPHGFVMFSLSNQGVTIAESAVSGASGTAFVTFVEELSNLRYGFAMANPSDSTTWTTFELLSIDGSSMNMSVSMEIPAMGHIAGFVDGLFPEMPQGFQGMLRIIATQPVHVTGLRFESTDRMRGTPSRAPRRSRED
jgi:Bacterial Ig domain